MAIKIGTVFFDRREDFEMSQFEISTINCFIFLGGRHR